MTLCEDLLYILSRPGQYGIEVGFAVFKFLLKLPNEVPLSFPSFSVSFSQKDLKILKRSCKV